MTEPISDVTLAKWYFDMSRPGQANAAGRGELEVDAARIQFVMDVTKDPKVMAELRVCWDETTGAALDALNPAVVGSATAGTASSKPLEVDQAIAELDAMMERDRKAGGFPWDAPDHPDNSQPGGWHHGQTFGRDINEGAEDV